jgi:hypothetical protein
LVWTEHDWATRLQPREAAGPGGSITYHVVLGNPTGRAIPLDDCPSTLEPGRRFCVTWRLLAHGST